MKKKEALPLIKKYKTPLFVYERRAIKDKVESLKKALGPDFEVSYSLKANPFVALVKFMKSLNLSADVSSLYEYEICRNLKFPANRISFSGPGKTEEELKVVAQEKVQACVESLEELLKLKTLKKQKPLGIFLRLNEGSFLKNHKHFQTPTQFGLDFKNFKKALELIKKSPKNLFLKGFHFHIGTQILDENLISSCFDKLLFFSKKEEAFLTNKLEKVYFGGGFGVDYSLSEKNFDLQKIGKRFRQIYKKHFKDSGLKVVLELGRFLVASSGFYFTEVLYKKSVGGKTFLILKGGMNHLFKMSLAQEENSRLHFPVKNLSVRKGKKQRVTLAGPSCSQYDILAKSLLLEETQSGDILCFEKTGAYCYTLSPIEFIHHKKAKEVLV